MFHLYLASTLISSGSGEPMPPMPDIFIVTFCLFIFMATMIVFWPLLAAALSALKTDRTVRRIMVGAATVIAALTWMATHSWAAELTPVQKRAMELRAQEVADQRVQIAAAGATIIEVDLITGKTARVSFEDLQWLQKKGKVLGFRIAGSTDAERAGRGQ